ncbi:alpha-hydroxy-acid oxidizing protein [Morganella morganii]
MISRRKLITNSMIAAGSGVLGVSSAFPASGSERVSSIQNQVNTNSSEKKMKFINLYDLENIAEKSLPTGAFGYVKNGAEDELTLKNNISSFDKKRILPHGLSAIDDIDLKSNILGINLKSPIILAPMAAHGLMHKDAEKETIKGVSAAGTIMSISTYASVPVEDIARSAPDTPLFAMLYMSKDNGFNEYFINKARISGAKAIILTIDAGTPGNRESDIRNNYQYSVSTPNVTDYYKGKTVTQSEARASRKISFSPDDIKYVKKVSGLPVLVKGIMSVTDAEKAISAGADGIWVSNHGGRQLDSAPASFDVLPDIVEAVNKRVPVIFDSGIRRGTHIFKALACGADIVAIGRPVLYGLHNGGADGVTNVFEHLNKELITTMILAGARNIDDIKKNTLMEVI